MRFAGCRCFQHVQQEFRQFFERLKVRSASGRDMFDSPRMLARFTVTGVPKLDDERTCLLQSLHHTPRLAGAFGRVMMEESD